MIAEPIPEQPAPVGRCRECGCTEDDCEQCLARTGRPCSWTSDAADLCTACAARPRLHAVAVELAEDTSIGEPSQLEVLARAVAAEVGLLVQERDELRSRNDELGRQLAAARGVVEAGPGTFLRVWPDPDPDPGAQGWRLRLERDGEDIELVEEHVLPEQVLVHRPRRVEGQSVIALSAPGVRWLHAATGELLVEIERAGEGGRG